MGIDQKFFNDAVRYFMKDLNKKLGVSCPIPTVAWDLTGGSSLGQAIGWKKIRLHPALAEAIGEDYLQVVGHEVAHIVTSYRIPPVTRWEARTKWSSHGSEWKNAMRLLGLPPDRTFKSPLSDEHWNAIMKPRKSPCTAVVQCRCNEYKVTPGRALRLINAQAECRKCDQLFVMVP